MKRFARPTAMNVRMLAILTSLVISAGAAHVVASARAKDDLSPGVSPGTPTVEQLLQADLVDSLNGLSDRLRFHLVEDSTGSFGAMAVDSAEAALAGPMLGSSPLDSIRFMHLLPFEAKRNGRLGSYRLGYWPAERGRILSAAYDNPAGFIEVTPENQETYVSEHFQLHDFLTHDQEAVWPKYIVLREPLIDKLELVIADLQRHGIPARHLEVMSGFRTPHYNALGVGEGGRARNSRHQYGDAADVFVDDDRDRVMDDLNRDGRVTIADARILLEAANRVERAHPELIGGAGLYRGTSTHGPFVHIDVRGNRARWGGA